MGTADAKGTTNGALVLNLDDDCLDLIFKHLEIKDQINLAACCPRLQDVFVKRAKVEYKVLDLEDLECLTLWEIQQFLEMTGQQIKKLSGHAYLKYFTRSVEFLGHYCLSVKSVSIKNNRLTATNMRKLLKNMHMVEVLQLNYADVADDCIPVLKDLKHLKILSIHTCFELTGEYIDGLTTLESLSLFGCTGIRPPLFTKICKNLTDLKYLDIEKCSLLPLSALQDVVKYMHKLETIKLSLINGEADGIASLPNLKHLHLYNEHSYDPVPSEIFVELAKHRADQLETLSVRGYSCIGHEQIASICELRKLKELICSTNKKLDDNCLSKISQLQELEFLNIESCRGFSDNGLLDLIQKCPKLCTLNVSYCRHLNEEFARKVLQLLISEKKQRDQQKPLKIIAHCSGIPKSAVNTTEFKSATDLLSISHDYQYEMGDMFRYDSDTNDSDVDYDEDENYFVYSSDF